MKEAAPRSQTSYQVRFEWGVAVDADVVAWIDEIGSEPVPPGARVTALAEAAEFAQWCLQRQEELGVSARELS
ncbi:hypothetical protein [Pseudolysinimonas sp.]|uniref:hypothetical protein n=1 Tax=Pseudolysinimonas sp. TaxID=2680009 RepID=UPI00286C962B|nr:hypothetical protein [Pseudolysinimonas sp.]